MRWVPLIVAQVSILAAAWFLSQSIGLYAIAILLPLGCLAGYGAAVLAINIEESQRR